MGLMTFGLSGQALAQCAPTTSPTGGETINCTGTSSTGIDNTNASNVTVNVSGGAMLQTPGSHAINLGTGTTVNVTGSSVIQSYVDSIRAKGGSTITIENGSGIQAFTDAAIVYMGNAGENFTVNLGGGIYGANGTAVNFGESNARLIVQGTASPGGNFLAGSGTDDTLVLEGSGAYDASWVGTLLFGFDKFEKTGSGTWTIVNSTSAVTPWTISGGILNVSADNQLGNTSGTLTLNGGTLLTGASFTSARNVALGASGGTFDTNGFGLTLSDIVSGAGSLTKTGTGTLILTGTNTYTGGTVINSGGAIRASSDAALGNAAGGITMNNGTLQYGAAFNSARNITGTSAMGINTNGFNSTLSGVISGTGGVTKTGAGTLTLTGVNTYSGGTTSILGGTLNVSADNNLGAASNSITINGGTLQYGATFNTARNITLGASNGTIDTNGFNSTLSGVISGTGALTKSGTGTLILSGTNTYSGGTTIGQGILQVGNDANLGNAAGGITFNNNATLLLTSAFTSARNMTLSSGAALVNTNGNSVGLSGVISGAGSLVKTGSGTLTLSGTNTYSGGTTINGGVLNVSAANNLGSGTTITMNGGTLQYGAGFSTSSNVSLGSSGGTFDTNGFNSTLLGVISGTGALTKAGTGVLTLNAANTYSGGTTISAGTLIGTTNSVQGNITNNGVLLFSQGGNGTYAGIISGSGSVAKGGSGTVILSGASTYTGGTAVSGGTLTASANNNLGNSSGTLTLSGGTFQFGSGFNLARNIVLGAGGGTLDANGIYGSNTITGTISGTGALTFNNWGKIDIANTSVMNHTGGTTISSGTQLGVDANILKGNVVNNGQILLGDGTLTANVSGTGEFHVYSGSDMSFTGTNTYTGNTNFYGTNFTLNNNNDLGATTNALGLDNATLKFGAALTMNRNTTLTNSAKVNTNGFDSAMSGVISGTGSLTKQGTGVLTLTGANTYSGGTTVSAGVLQLTGSFAGNITNNATVFFSPSGNQTYSGVMSGTGGFIKYTGSTLILSGANTYTGSSNINAGRIQVSADNNLGAASSVVNINGGILQYGAGFTSARAVTLGGSNGTIDTNGFSSTLSGVVSGIGSLTKTGAGTLIMTGTNTYSGGTTVSAGSLWTTTASLPGNVTNNASVNFFQNNNGTYNGVMSGTGTLFKNGTGAVTLSGTNTYTGGTSILGGILNVSADNNLGNASGALTLNGGTLQYGAGFTTSRTVNLGTSHGTVDTNGFNATLGNITGSGNLIKTGAGQLSIYGATYAGDTIINQGRVIGSQSSYLGNIVLNGTSEAYMNVSSNGAYNGIISGTGSLLKYGSGTLTLTGTNTHTGGTSVTAGILNVSADNNLGDAAGNLSLSGGILQYGAGFSSARAVTLGASNGTIDTNGFSSTLSGVIGGTGSLTKTGTGTLTLSGTNTYTGGTIVNQGIVRANTDANLGNAAGSLTLNNASLQYGAGFSSARNVILGTGNGTINTNNFTTALSGIISGTGTLSKAGGGTLTLSGANTYTGGTSISGGTLSVSADANLGDASGGITMNAGTLQYTANFSSARAITLNGIGGTIDTGGFNSSIGGVISGPGNLIKTGAGILTLTGVNTYSGTTTISVGTLRTTTNIGRIVNNAILQFNQGFTGTHTDIISGSGTVEKINSGTVTLSGVNTYTGGTTVSAGILNVSADNNLGDSSGGITLNGGTLQYGAAFTSTRAITLGAANGTIDTNGFASVLSGIVSGTGSLTKVGTGTLTMSGANTYSGGTTVSAGTLQGTTTSLQGNIVNNANLAFSQTTSGTYAGVISGSGTVFKNNTGEVIFTGANTYTGGTVVQGGGTLQVSADNNLGGAGSLALNGGTLKYGAAFTSARAVSLGASNGTINTNSYNATLSGIISGTGSLTKAGTGSLTLSGTNTYTGGTVVNGGELRMNSDDRLGAVSGALTVSNAAISLTAAQTVARNVVLSSGAGSFHTNGVNSTLSGVISGSGSLTKIGTGRLTLTGANTYTGGTTITSGELRGTTASLQGDILNNASLIFEQGTNGTYANVISGTGGLVKGGVGIVTLSGVNTYSGTTLISGGALNVSADNNLGSGSLNLSGGTLQYGASFNTARNMTFGASSGTIDTNGFNSTLSGTLSGTGGLTKTGAGVLTLSGVNTYSGGTTISGGTVIVSADANLGDVSGALTLDGGTLKYAASFNSARNLIIGASGGTIDVGIYNSILSGVVSGTGALSKIGTGILTLTGANTYTGGTLINAGQIIAVNADNNLGNGGALTFDGGTLQYGAAFNTARDINLLAGGGTIDTNGFNSTLSGAVAGAGSLVKNGTGTLTLTGANTYMGGTVLNSGTLNVSAHNNLGDSSGALTLNGGTLQYGASFNTSRNIVSQGGLINTNGYDSTLSGVVSGSELAKYGTGTLTLTGNNTYTARLYIAQGTVNVNSDAALGSGSSYLTLNGGTLQYGAAFNSARNVTLNASGGTIDTNGFNSALSGVLSGTGALNKLGTGTLILTGTNTYAGGTTVSAGTLAGTTNSLQGNITNDSILAFSQATNGTYADIVSGTGALIKDGAGTVILSGVNTYTGGTTVSGGILQASADNNLGGVGAITLNGGTLQYGAAFNSARNIALGASNGGIDTNGFNATLSGVISGAGGLVKTGTGTLTLTGVNTYTGGTQVSAGTLIGTTDNLVGNITNDATIGFAQNTNGTYSGMLSGSGALVKTGSGIVTLSGASSYTGDTTISAGVLAVSADNNLGSAGNTLNLDGGTLRYDMGFSSARDMVIGASNGTLNTNGFDSTVSGAISGAGALTKSGSGKLILSGLNTYAGGTTVSAGTLAGTTASLQGNIVNNAALWFEQNGNGSYADVISGSGSLNKAGTGTVVLSGANTYTGNTAVSAGKLVVNGSTIGSSTTVSSGAALGGSGTTGNLTINGALTPGNSIGTLNVTGNVVFNPNSTYEVEVDAAGNNDKTIATGALTINGGTVDVRAASGSYSDLTNYTILQGSSRTGTFTNVISDLAFFDPTLSYTATTVDLALTRNGTSFDIVANDDVQAGVADAVENLGTGNDLYDAFVGLNVNQASQALDTLSGEHNSGLASSTMQSSATVRNVILGRIQNMARGSDAGSQSTIALRTVDDGSGSQFNAALVEPAAGGGDYRPAAYKKSWWSDVFGTRGKSDAQGTAPSQNRESGGMIVGMDAYLDSETTVGAFGGWERGEVYTDSQMANSDVESWHGGIYGSYMPGTAWRFSGGLSGSFHQMDTTRHIAFSSFNDTAKGETEGFTASGYAEAGYTIDYNDVALEPFAGISLTHTTIGDYREKEGGAANLDIDSVSQTTPSHTIGVRAAKAITVGDVDMTVRGKLGWDHNYGDLSSTSTMSFAAGNTPFNVNGSELARDSAVVGLGLETLFTDQTKAYVTYDGSFAPDDRNNSLTLGVKIKF